MTKLNIIEPEVGTKNSVAEPRIPTALKEIEKVVNGELEGTNNLKAEGVTEASLEKALREKIAAKVTGLELVKHGAGFEAKSGEFCLTTFTGTATLPKAINNLYIVFFCGTGTLTINAAEKGARIYGDFVTNAESIKLVFNNHVALFAEENVWNIVSGEPKREAVYGAVVSPSKAECEAGIVLNTVRPVHVIVEATGELRIGGVAVMKTGAVGYIVNPGQGLSSATGALFKYQVLNL